MLRRPTLALWLLALALGAACLFTLSEQDIFWQLRAGDALWQSGQFPSTDTWSYTAYGAPWRNFEWLATLLLRGLWASGGVPALVLWRGAWVSTLCLLWILAAQRAGASPLQAGTLTLLLWTAALPRLQLRPELFVLLLQAALTLVWLGPRRLPVQRAATLLAALLAANLHPGVTPLLVLSSVPWLLQHPTRGAWACLLGCTLAPLATPHGIEVVPFLWNHVNYFAQGVLPNPEHRRLTPRDLLTPSGLAAVFLLATAATAATKRIRHAGRPLRHTLPAALAGILWLGLCLERTRALPFACSAALPWAAATGPRIARSRAVLAAALAAWAVLPVIPAWGLGLDPQLSPVLATRYLAEKRPQAKLLHNYTDGAYLVWARRNAPLFVDTRETLYWSLEAPLGAAFADPNAMEAWVQKYQIDTVLLPIPNDITGRLGQIFVPQRWALVYFDATRLILARRDRLAAHESTYTWLDPTRPANAYAHSTGRTAQTDAQVSGELARCLEDDARNAWCWIARGALQRAQGAHDGALEDLGRARALLASERGAQWGVLGAELQRVIH